MNAPTLVRRYAVTLLEAAVDTQVLEPVHRDVQGLVETLRQSPDLVSFLLDRRLDPGTQHDVLEELFAGKVQGLTLNYLRLVVQRRRAYLLPEVLEAFCKLVEERAGVVRAEVRSAVELSEEQAERLRERLAAYTGKKVRLQVQVDGSLRGGLVARVGDTIFDGSLEAHLERLHRQLRGA